MRGMSLDDFLEHSAGGGTRGNFLKNWRKSEPAKIIVWLHLSVGLGFARWAHNWPRTVIREDRDTGKARREIWGGTWVCHENELVLRKQRFRDENDERELPPVVCPLCKTIEVVRRMVREGEIDWTEPVFRFRGDDSERDMIIRAGGIYNAFSRRDLTAAEKGELRRAGIRPSEAWRENAIARCQYTFAVVDQENPEDGVQITDEAEALGNALKRVLRDKIEEIGREKGNPLRNPYPFLWEYRADEPFEKKYRVVPKTTIELTDEIRELISGEPPDLSGHLKPGNVATLRSEMEEACLIEGFPFDEIFAEAESRIGKHDPSTRDRDEEDVDEEESIDFDPEKYEREAKPSKPSKPSKPEPSEELYVCDVCDFDGLRETDVVCPKCGSEYNEDGEVTSRPCANCKALVSLSEATGGMVRCGECATNHDVETWEVVEQKKKRRLKPKGSLRSNPRAIDPEDDLPWGK